jgi:hypothetical protein
LPLGAAKVEVWSGVRRMCRDVRSGFGDGDEGEMWWRKRVDAGPEESRRG